MRRLIASKPTRLPDAAGLAVQASFQVHQVGLQSDELYPFLVPQRLDGVATASLRVRNQRLSKHLVDFLLKCPCPVPQHCELGDGRQ